MTDQERRNTLEAWQQTRRLLSAGFSVEQARRLIQLREACRRGTYRDGADCLSRSDLARLGFARHLVQTGRLSEDGPE